MWFCGGWCQSQGLDWLVYSSSSSSSSSSNCNRCGNKPRHPSTTVPKKEIILVLQVYLGVQNKIVAKQLKTCINKFYDCIYHRVVFQSAYRIKSLFLTKIGSTIPNCQYLCIGLVVGTARIFIIGKTKRRLCDRKTEYYKACKLITSSCHASAIVDHVTSTGHNKKYTSKRSVRDTLLDNGDSTNKGIETHT